MAALMRLRDVMASDATGRRLLKDRPRVDDGVLDSARQCATGSFGHAYAAFMDGHDFDPGARAVVRYVDDPECAFVMQRYREVHDFWHVLTGVPPTVLGEVGLKWVEMVQTGLPMTALSAFVGPLALPSIADHYILATRVIPWATNRCRT